MIFLVNISTTSPAFQFGQLAGFVLHRGSSRDGRVFLGVRETSVPSGLWERITLKRQIGHSLPQHPRLRGPRGLDDRSGRVGLFSPPPSWKHRHSLTPGPAIWTTRETILQGSLGVPSCAVGLLAHPSAFHLHQGSVSDRRVFCLLWVLFLGF